MRTTQQLLLNVEDLIETVGLEQAAKLAQEAGLNATDIQGMADYRDGSSDNPSLSRLANMVKRTPPFVWAFVVFSFSAASFALFPGIS